MLSVYAVLESVKLSIMAASYHNHVNLTFGASSVLY